MIENIREKSVCQLCREEFECGSKSSKCWCFDINTSLEFLAELSDNYDKCLCRKCLVQLKINADESKSTIAENGK